MSHSFELTDKHLEILEPLTKKVRVLSRNQIARSFYPNAKTNKRAQLLVDELVKANFLSCFDAMVHPEIELQGPLCRYQPGDVDPDFATIARKTRGRWREVPVATELIFATDHTKQVLGGYIGGKQPRPSEVRHDIHVAQIYLRFLKEKPELAATWKPEDRIREERGSNFGLIADAIVGTTETILIEFGGAYPRSKLEAFHAEQKFQRYEVW